MSRRQRRKVAKPKTPRRRKRVAGESEPHDVDGVLIEVGCEVAVSPRVWAGITPKPFNGEVLAIERVSHEQEWYLRVTPARRRGYYFRICRASECRVKRAAPQKGEPK